MDSISLRGSWSRAGVNNVTEAVGVNSEVIKYTRTGGCELWRRSVGGESGGDRKRGVDKESVGISRRTTRRRSAKWCVGVREKGRGIS
jgi:hypothetical protein